MLYSRDMSSLPSLVRPLVGHALAAGVVQPQTEEQGIKLAAFSRIHNVPLVPHGKATSGYGGVVPVKGGLVVDFAWMNQVLAIDPEARTATVQPGVVWQKLEQALNKLGRKPR
jgi:FAD/FMN-containing dehydrogenase